MKRLLFLSLACLTLSCSHLPSSDNQLRNLQAQLKTVVIEDGIDFREAEIIAQSYFYHFGPGCGVAPHVSDDGQSWISNTPVGYAATPTREPIRIDKQSGRVTWSDGPPIEDPKNIFKSKKNSSNVDR
jgi:hypothetical protein